MPTPNRYRKRYGPYPKCSVDWCMNESDALSGGPCDTHKMRKNRGIPQDAPMRVWRHKDECAFEGCDRARRSRDWCTFHYQQWKHGRELTPKAKFSTVGTPAKWGVCGLPQCDYRAREGFTLCQPHRTVAKKYGMTFDSFMEFWGDGSCRVCGKHAARMAVDHDHRCCPGGNEGSCGQCNRGLLCQNCNISLGLAEDSPARLREMIAYLETYAVSV